MILGHDAAIAQFAGAWARRSIHHAWLLAGPKGVGKALFARAAATRVLADAAGPLVSAPGIETPSDHRIAKLIEAGSHPDMRLLQRLPKDKGEGLARSISVDQVRAVAQVLDFTPALSPWRVVVIDSADDLERSAANALLKMLEEPPPNTIFLLVSHAPGRLLPTIRSRCRRLEFAPLDSDVMAAIVAGALPDLASGKAAAVIEAAGGSAGRAIALAELDLAPLQQLAMTMLRDGDPANTLRSRLASELGKKGTSDRYAAFLELAPVLIASEARRLTGPAQKRALDAYAQARELVAVAPRLSLDPAATAFQLGSMLASVAAPRLP